MCEIWFWKMLLFYVVMRLCYRIYLLWISMEMSWWYRTRIYDWSMYYETNSCKAFNDTIVLKKMNLVEDLRLKIA